ncbi:hypothetical protein [Nonlabens dokdonensis]|uniref:hypothetical protein n=1 Tax=Nonlabens dokdonensis TaxID=328515 RepID=UPI0002E2E43C|nr:hypothetical protein [Nonlabens dokdonensis]
MDLVAPEAMPSGVVGTLLEFFKRLYANHRFQPMRPKLATARFAHLSFFKERSCL